MLLISVLIKKVIKVQRLLAPTFGQINAHSMYIEFAKETIFYFLYNFFRNHFFIPPFLNKCIRAQKNNTITTDNKIRYFVIFLLDFTFKILLLHCMKPETIKKILVTRFSAMGDVAMLAPVVSLVALQHPELRITVLTRKKFVPLFGWVPSNVEVKGINLSDYKGVFGLERLFNSLRKQGFDAVADLHDVLRTKYLHTRFRLTRTKVAVIDKQRKLKHAFIGHGMDADALRPMYERYADVFRRLGIEVSLNTDEKLFNLKHEDYQYVTKLAGKKATGDKWIGIAPFAAHETKIYPLQKMQEVVNWCAQQGYKVFLFGGGDTEKSILETWEKEGITNTIGRLSGLHNELLLISRLDLMVCMDSSNMHIAAMLGVPTLSIWGATHPNAGFFPWGTSRQNTIEIIDLPCRPCSIYGSKPCKTGDFRCMNDISAELIEKRIAELL